MQKAVFDCNSGELIISELTNAENDKIEADRKAAEDQKVLDSLIPTEKEILMAEIEIQTIEILREGGLL